MIIGASCFFDLHSIISSILIWVLASLNGSLLPIQIPDPVDYNVQPDLRAPRGVLICVEEKKSKKFKPTYHISIATPEHSVNSSEMSL